MKISDGLRKQLILLSNPLRFSFIKKEFGDKPFRLLDIGAGNHSAVKTNLVFPNCEYYGLDITRDYNYDSSDFNLMKDFYEMDLTELKFEGIPDNFFDVIIMSHIIEHLYNGDLVIEGLLKKLRAGGFIYLEYPGLRSSKLPRMQGTLNFFDDPTHVRIFNINELYNLFLKSGIRPIKGGTRRNYVRILLMPFLIPYRLIRKGHLVGSDFWDLLGFAEYVIGKK